MPEICEEEFCLSPEEWLKTALGEPVIITDKGQPKLYVLSKAVVDSLYKGSRKACKVWDLDEEGKKALLEAEVSPEHDHLNALLKED